MDQQQRRLGAVTRAEIDDMQTLAAGVDHAPERRRLLLRRPVRAAGNAEQRRQDSNDNQQGHAHENPLRTARYPRGAASMIRKKSSALRLAPPTSAPSTLAMARISFALSGFTEPP